MVGWFLSPIWSSSSFPDPRRNDFGRWGKSTRTRTTFLPGTIGVFSWTWSMGGGGNQVGDAPLYSALYSSSMTHTRWKRNEWKCLHKLSPVSLELFDTLPGSWFTEEALSYYVLFYHYFITVLFIWWPYYRGWCKNEILSTLKNISQISVLLPSLNESRGDGLTWDTVQSCGIPWNDRYGRKTSFSSGGKIAWFLNLAIVNLAVILHSLLLLLKRFTAIQMSWESTRVEWFQVLSITSIRV